MPLEIESIPEADRERIVVAIEKIARHFFSPEEIVPLSTQASGRKYYRVRSARHEELSLIIALLNKNAGPVVEVLRGPVLNQDDAFFEMSSFFINNKIKVPQVLIDGRGEHQFFVLSDGGPHGLSDELLARRFDRIPDVLALQWTIRQLTPPPELVCSRRQLGKSSLLDEAERINTRWLSKEPGVNSGTLELISSEVSMLVNEVSQYPQVLITRDFMPWNLQCSGNPQSADGMTLLDFQDSCFGPRTYDLASFFFDRGIPEVLGPDVLFHGLTEGQKLGGGWGKEEFAMTLLQRHVRLAGQFLFLHRSTGNEQWLRWWKDSVSHVVRLTERLGRFPAIREAVRKHARFDYAPQALYKFFG